MRHHRAGHATGCMQGFTLVEVLVVLVITALVSALLLQALAQIYRLQGRFGEQLSQSQVGVMRADWYRQLVQGLKPDFTNGKQKFSGNAERLQGLSATLPGAAGGAPRWVELWVQRSESAAQGGSVRLRVGDQESVLFDWSARGRAELAYLDDDGQEYSQWPPLMQARLQLGPDPLPPAQLPAAVLLKLPTEAGLQVLVAVPRGVREDRLRPFNLGATVPGAQP